MAFSTKTAVKLHYILSQSAQSTGSEGVGSSHDQNFQQDESHDDLANPRPRRYVLIHGLFFGNLASWYPLVTQSLSQKADVLCYDLRGHGLSEAPLSGYQLDSHLNDLFSLLAELGWLKHSICFIGHSFGARLALAAIKKKSLLNPTQSEMYRFADDRMLLIDPPLLMSNRDDQDFFEKLKTSDINELKAHLPSSLTLLLSKEGRRLRKMLKRWSYLLEETRFLEELEDLGDISEEDAVLISQYGCVLFGSNSGCFRAYPFLRNYVDEERIQVIEGGGHFLLNQSPQCVLRFIQESVPLLSRRKV